tara:strand:+ start:3183 stop:3623 length:441 start_codon:yes stop_codon:yes gene_type:complete
MDYKKTNAARTTVSRDLQDLANSVGGNVYELISILQQRSNQIGVEIKEELLAKLDEFATHSDTLEEVFENQEQTEISRFYERLPKATLIAIQELMDDQIYVREKVKKESLDLNTEDSLIDLSDENQEVIDDEKSDSSAVKSEEADS